MPYTQNFKDSIYMPIWCVRGAYKPSVLVQVDILGSRTGEKVKDFKEKIRAGKNAASVYTLDRTKLLQMQDGYATYSGIQLDDPAPGVPRTTVKETWGGYNQILPSPITHIAVSESKADSIALSKIYKKITDELQHMNSPAVLAEFGDVMRQFGAPASAMVDLTNRHVNRLFLERRGLGGSTTFKRIKWHKILASTYLEYAFGLAPLISDTRKAAEALAKWQHEKSGEARFRKAIRSRGEDIAVQVNPGGPTRAWESQFFYVKNSWKKTTTCSVQYNVGLNQLLLADFGSNERLLQLLGFKPENWIPALWEVVPWSWLVDYFTNVQQILDACVTSQAGVTWVSRTVRHRSEMQATNDIDTSYSKTAAWNSNWRTVAIDGHCGKWNAVRTTLARTVPAGLGVPSLYLELPRQYGQLANMVAVLFSRRTSSSNLWLT